MKEDVLEQLVDDYLKSKGFFTVHNVRFGPSKEDDGYNSNQDNQPSDIDVLGFHPLIDPPDNVWVVSCKSWQPGLDVRTTVNTLIENPDKRVSGRAAWKGFRELVKPKWKAALVRKVKGLTGTSNFTHVTAVTRIRGEKSLWETNHTFLSGLDGCKLRMLSLSEMLDDIYDGLTTTTAPSEIGRVLQLIKAAEWTPPFARR